MKKNKLTIKISNRIKRWLHPLILSENQWLRPLSEQIENLNAIDPDYFVWLVKHKLIDALPRLMLPQTPRSKDILFSVVIPVYNTPSEFLQKAVNSVIRQIYSEWEIVICDDASDSEETLNCLEIFQKKYNYGKPVTNQNHRIKIITNRHNKGISESTNTCVEHSNGDFIIFLDHDDELYPDALLKTKEAVDLHPHAKVFYSDEDYISSDGYRHSYNFKPDFSPSFLETHNYILHMVCVKKDLFVKAGGLRKAFDGSQDYDFLLRLMDMGEKFVHIQDILYSWRENATSMIGGMLKPEIFNRGKKSLQEHYIRSGDSVEYIKDNLDNIDGVYRTRFAMPENISVLVVKIGNRDFGFDPYEVGLSINMEIITWDPSYPFPVEIADTHADIVLFFDSMLVPHSWQEFVKEIVPLALRKNIGAVGALIYSGDDKIIAAGRSLMPWGAMRNDFWGYDAAEKNSPAKQTRDVIAVSGAAMAISSEMLKSVLMKGDRLDKSMWDVEIAFRLHVSGYRVVFTPHAFVLFKGALEQYHGSAMFDVRQISETYNVVKDPYLNINLLDNTNAIRTDKKVTLPSQFKKRDENITKDENLTEEDRKKRDQQDKKKNNFYHKWLAFYSPDLKKSPERISKLEYKPFISIILPTYNSELFFFKKLLHSLQSQTYTNFEICISDDASSEPLFMEFLKKIESETDNICVIYSDKNS
ncbi:MAG: glycosyltransferase, partial [Desulfamplus sp.]|nr:glycosyltransferase [Desulfamplus sp.]